MAFFIFSSAPTPAMFVPAWKFGTLHFFFSLEQIPDSVE